MRLTEFPIIQEIKEEYIELRHKGVTRDEAVQQLMQFYKDEITIGEQDDGVLFWIGLADGQYAMKELSTIVAQYGLTSLDKLPKDITLGDVFRRKQHYALAPMPERKALRERKKFRCQWVVGDTFAHQIKGYEAEELGIAGKYMLFRKVDAYEFGDGRLLPVVTASLWDKLPFPTNSAEFQSVPLLKICPGGRMGTPKNLCEYRAEIILKNTKELEAMQLEYVGNFQNILMPDDEILFLDAGLICMMIPEHIDSECCVFWKMHCYCIETNSK